MYNGKVAVIDDEPLLVKILTDLLNRVGISVEAFVSGTDALNTIIPHLSKYSCIITDFDMPEMTGIELAAKIRGVSFDLPIIITSGDRNMLNDDELERFRVNAVLKKPFTKDELFKCLNTIIDIPIHSKG